MFCCLGGLRPGSIYALVAGCIWNIRLDTATMNALQALCSCHSPRKTSRHNESTEWKADWQLKGGWVGGVLQLLFYSPLPVKCSFELRLLLYRIQFVMSQFLQSEGVRILPDKNSLALLDLTIYRGERSCGSFALGKTAEYEIIFNTIQQKNYVLSCLMMQEPSKFHFPEVVCFFWLHCYMDIFIKYKFIYKIFCQHKFSTDNIFFSGLETYGIHRKKLTGYIGRNLLITKEVSRNNILCYFKYLMKKCS